MRYMTNVKFGLIVVVTCMLTMQFLACGSEEVLNSNPTDTEISESLDVVATDEPEDIEETEETEGTGQPSNNEKSDISGPEGPVLSTTLKKNCSPTADESFESAGLVVGEMAIDFTLKDINGNECQLSKLLAEKPVMIEFGSFT